ncbi:ankyrin repeat domain-containing protein, partial [Flavonifractor plautii]|nr:ankyrin repeat domain-containing protein [Flavonifractor plautii]
GPVGKRMARLMLGTKSPYPEDVWLDACKRAVDTGDLQRVQMMLDQTMDKVANPSPALPGEVLRYAFGQNRAMARELIRWATPEQVAAAPSRLLCGAAYAHDLPMLTELLQKGLQPGDQAAPLLRPLLAAYDEQRVAHLLRDSLRVQPEDYEAMNVCLRAQAQAAAEALLERGMKLDGYLAWAAKQDVLLDTQAQEILDCLAEQQAQVNSVPEQNGPVLGGMSL